MKNISLIYNNFMSLLHQIKYDHYDNPIIFTNEIISKIMDYALASKVKDVYFLSNIYDLDNDFVNIIRELNIDLYEKKLSNSDFNQSIIFIRLVNDKIPFFAFNINDDILIIVEYINSEEYYILNKIINYMRKDEK